MEGEGVEFFLFLSQFLLLQLGATSIDKIGEGRLSDEIGGFEILKKMKFIITSRYEIPMFSSLGPIFGKGEGVQIISARS